MNTTKLFSALGWKPDIFTFEHLLISLIVFFSPIYLITIGIVSLIVLDFITGIIASYKTGVELTSNRASRTVYKFFVYVVLLMSCLIFDKLVNIDICVKTCTFFLSLVELYSIGENFKKITQLDFISYLKTIIETRVKGSSKIIDEVKEQEEVKS